MQKKTKDQVQERDQIDSVVLRRLIKEVEREKTTKPVYYNRIHNRHNRGGG